MVFLKVSPGEEHVLNTVPKQTNGTRRLISQKLTWDSAKQGESGLRKDYAERAKPKPCPIEGTLKGKGGRMHSRVGVLRS
jgi:hypothetical protein